MNRTILLTLMPVWLLVSGCAVLPEQTTSTSWMKRPAVQGLEENVVQLDAALLERPLGDAYLNKDLWQFVDEQVIELDRKPIVDENGFRVGQIVGMTPANLHALLKSERSCINPRRRLVPAGHTVTQVLGPVISRAEFELRHGKQKLDVAFDQARFCLDVTATLTRDGKTKLTFTPKVENGELTLPFAPDPEQSTWHLKIEKPCKVYRDLAWDVVLAPNEYLVIGPDLSQANSLAARSFLHPESGVQRLLILRTSRTLGNEDTNEPTLEDIARSKRAPCLAAQAPHAVAVRASGP